MTVDDMVAELGGLFSLNAAVISRAAALYRELKARGVTIQVRSAVFRTLVPKVADGVLAAEAVAAFADEPKTLNVVGRLDVAEQVRLAGGGTVEVLAAVNGTPTAMTVREVVAGNFPAIVAGRVLTVEQQRVQLQAREKAAARPAAKAVAANESQVQALARILAEQMERHGLTRLSPQAAAELVAASGWRPAKAVADV